MKQPDSAEIQKFIRENHFSGYQRIEFPDGQVIEGDDRSDVAQTILGDVTGKTVLDIGTYYGFFAHEAIKRGAVSATGLEPDPHRFQLAHRISELMGDAVTIQQERVEDLKLEATHDIVLLLNVLHHVADPLEVMRRAVRAARQEVIVEFTTPADPQFYRVAFPSFWRRLMLKMAGFKRAYGGLMIGISDAQSGKSFYFGPQAFQGVFQHRLGLFETVDFNFAASRPARLIARCRVVSRARSEPPTVPNEQAQG